MKDNEKKLDAMIILLQDLFILKANKAGIKKDDVRKILGINVNRITKIWKCIKNTDKK